MSLPLENFREGLSVLSEPSITALDALAETPKRFSQLSLRIS